MIGYVPIALLLNIQKGKWTHLKKIEDKEIIDKLLSIHPNNKILKIYREVKNGKTRIYIDYVCGECGFIWKKINWDAIKKRQTKYCKECKEREKKYTVDFIEKELIKLGFKWLNKDNYIDANSPLETKCLKCGKIAKANVTNRVIDKRQCNRCIGQDVKTIEEFKKEVYELEGNNYTVLSNLYTETHASNILIKHNECGHEYLVSRSNFRKGRRCPNCNKSKGEIKISNYLQNKKINFISQKEFDDLLGVGRGNLSYDFYLLDYNLLIEYQGKYHDGSVSYQSEEEFKKQQEHDRRKREYAKKHNIDLLEIWYWDFDNIENILEERLFDGK